MKCLVTGCALVLEGQDPSKYQWGDMHIVNGAYVFNAVLRADGGLSLNHVDQLTDDSPIFRVHQQTEYFGRRGMYVITTGVPNGAFLARQNPLYARKAYGVALAGQDRLVAPFYSVELADAFNSHNHGDGVYEVVSPLMHDAAVASARLAHLQATRDWGRHPDVERSSTGRLSFRENPVAQNLPSDAASVALSATIASALSGTATAATPPWESGGGGDFGGSGAGGSF